MRNVTSSLRSVVESGSYAIHLDVLIEAATSPTTTAMRSYRDYLGENWIVGCNFTESVDQTIASGTLTLAREHQGYSLAPLMEGSVANGAGTGFYAPAIDAGREIEVRVAILPQAQSATLSSAVSVDAEDLPVSALPFAAPAGTAVLIGAAVPTVTTEAVAKGATSIPVRALPTGAASGALVVLYGTLPDAAYSAVTIYELGNWIPLLQGVTDKPDWGGKDNAVTVTFRNRLGVLADAQTWDSFKVGLPEVLTPVETVIQQIIDHEAPGTFASVTPLPSSPLFDIEYGDVEPQLVWEAINGLVDQYGGRVQFKQPYGYGDYQLCLILPDSEDLTPDYTVAPTQYIDLPTVDLDPSQRRTVIRVKYVDSETGEIGTYQYPAADAVATDPAVLKYGERRMQLAFGATHAINTEAEAATLARRAYDALSTSLLAQEVECFTVPWVELDDIVTLPANGFHYDTDQIGAVSGITWTFGPKGVGRMRIRCAEKPVGGFKRFQMMDAQIWGFNATQKEPTPSTPLVSLDRFGPIEKNALGVTVGWQRSDTPPVAQVWVYELTATVPFNSAPVPDGSTARTAVLVTQNDYFIAYPPKGQEKFVYFVPVSATGRQGPTQVSHVLPATGFPEIAFTSTQGSSELYSDVQITVTDPQSLGGILYVWLNRTNPGDATAADDYLTGDFDAARSIVSTPSTSGTLNLFSVNPGGALVTVLDDVRTHPNLGKMIFAEFVNSLGVSSGVQKGYLKGWGTIVDGSGALKPGAVSTGSQIADAVLNTAHFAAGIAPVRVVAGAVKPAVGLRDGDTITLTGETPRRVYQWNGTPPAGAWVDIGSNATAVVGQLVAAQIAAGAIGTDQLAARSVTIEKLVVASLDNLAGNGHFQTGTTLGWSGTAMGGLAVASGAGAFNTTNVGQWVATNATGYISPALFNVRPGDSYYFSSAGLKNTATWSMTFNVRWRDRAGAQIGSTVVLSTFSSAIATTQRYGGIVTAPANAATAEFLFLSVNATPTGSWLLGEVTIRKAAQGELIVDGTIVATKLSTDAVWAHLVATGLIGNTLVNPTSVIRLSAAAAIPASAISYLDISGATAKFKGDLEAAGGTFTGALTAATGTFTGSLSAATGTFAGTLSLDTVAGNALEFRNSGSLAVSVKTTIESGRTASSWEFANADKFSLYNNDTGTGVDQSIVLQAIVEGVGHNIIMDGSGRTVLSAAELVVDSTKFGVYGTPGVARPSVTGSRGGNAALTSLLAALASQGIILNNTT